MISQYNAWKTIMQSLYLFRQIGSDSTPSAHSTRRSKEGATAKELMKVFSEEWAASLDNLVAQFCFTTTNADNCAENLIGKSERSVRR